MKDRASRESSYNWVNEWVKGEISGEGKLERMVDQFYQVRGSVGARLDVNPVYDKDLEFMLDSFLELVWVCEELMRHYGYQGRENRI